MKKLLFAMVALLCSAVATAHDFEVDGISYNFTWETEFTVEVTYRGDNSLYEEYSGSIVIPASVSYDNINYSVTSIGERAFMGCSAITNITIPNSVTSIEDSAFDGCSGLTNITIPNSVTSIANNAFDGCSGLTNITIPSSVTSITNSAFDDCSGLTSIVVESGNSVYDSRDNCNAIIETKTNTLIRGCYNSVIPNSVTSIGNSAFYGCNSLTNITIPNSVTSIEGYAFCKCSNLESVTFGDKLEHIESSAFNLCTKLKSLNGLVWQSGCKYYIVDNYLIDNENSTLVIGTSLEDLPSYSRLIKHIGDFAFSNKTFAEGNNIDLVIHEGIETIGKNAFCSAPIKSIKIPSTVTKIDSYAFGAPDFNGYDCEELKAVYINDLENWFNIDFSCTGSNPLYYAKNLYLNGVLLDEIEIPNNVSNIKRLALQGWNGHKIVIPSSVTSIGSSAFSDCENLESITSNISADSLFALIGNAFSEVDKNTCTLYVPYGSKATYAATDGWNEFTNIVEMESTTPVTISVDSLSTAPGRSVTLPVSMTNSEAITAFQIDVEIPEGIEFVSATLSDERKTTTHYLNTSVLATGKRRIIAYSNENKAFKLSEGTLLNINLDVPKETENGNYEVKVSNIRLVKPDSKEILLDPISANINVKQKMGDANDDFDVTMGDVVAVANYILELFVGTFNVEAADINGDGEITMGDLVAIINIILYPEDYDYGRNAKRGVMAASGAEISLPDTRSTDEAVSVPVSLSSTMAYTAFQMDIELPEGAKLASAALTERAAAHSVAWSCLPDGKMRVVAYSLDNEVFSGNAGELVALNIEAEGAVSGAISVENVLMVTATGDEYAIGNCGSLLDINGTTGINGTEAGSLKVYTADGALIVESGKAMKVAVYSVNGKLVKTLDVAEGKNVYEGMPAGTYVVAGVKVAIK